MFIYMYQSILTGILILFAQMRALNMASWLVIFSETNLKPRASLQVLADVRSSELLRLRGHINAPAPSAEFKFDGALHLEGQESVPITYKNILLRVCIMHNKYLHKQTNTHRPAPALNVEFKFDGALYLEQQGQSQLPFRYPIAGEYYLQLLIYIYIYQHLRAGTFIRALLQLFFFFSLLETIM